MFYKNTHCKINRKINKINNLEKAVQCFEPC